MKQNEVKQKLDIIYDSLLKKANGYYADEIIEEYAYDQNGREELLKKKVTKKFVPPDLNATKLLLEYYTSTNEENFENLSEEEIDQKAIKLIKEYAEMANIEKVLFEQNKIKQN